MAASMDDKSSVQQVRKTCTVIDHITASDSYFVDSNKHETSVICAVVNGTDKAYLYENGSRKVILQFTCTCLRCYSFKNSEGCYFLFCLTDGSIVCYKAATSAEHDKKKKKKKKKSKHKESDKEKQEYKEPTSTKAAKAQEQPDIFADLLRSDANQNIKQEDHEATTTSIAPITLIGEKYIIIKEENVQDFLVINNCLVTLAELKHGWTLSVYQMKTDSKLVSVNGDCPGNIPLCEKSPIYRTYFPKANIPQRTNLIGSLSHLGHYADQSATNQKPCMKCIISNTTQIKPQVGATQSQVLVLEDVLYNELFGSGSNLLDSPVIIIGIPDGRTYQVVLKSLRNQAEVEEHKRSEVKSVDSASVGFTGNMLYHLKEPVVDIHALYDKDQSNDRSGSKCLLLLGSQGKIVTITHSDQETSKQLQYEEHCITGPVVSSCSTSSHVLYSSPRALFAVSVKCNQDGGSSTRGRKHCAIMSASLGVGRVRALDVLRSTIRENGEVHMELMATLANGKVVVLNFPLSDSHGNQSQPITAAAAGQRMKELLHAINNVSIRMNQLSVISDNQDKVLEELSKACHLTGLLLGSHFESHDASIFKTQVQCVFQDEGGRCHVSLECKVTNQSSFVLSHGWALILCMDGRTDWPMESGKRDALNQLTRSVQLKEFAPGKTTTVCVNIDSTRVPLRLPLHLKWHLYFSLSDFIEHITKKQVMSDVLISTIELDDSGALLTFGSDTVDILTVLRPDRSNLSRSHQGDMESVQTTCNTDYDWLSKSLDCISSGRPLSNRKSSDERRTDGPVSTIVTFKEENIEAVKKEIRTEIEGGNNSEVLVMKWLTMHNPSLLAALTGNQLNTVTTEGKRVSFVAARKDVEAGKGNGVELTMTGPDYESVCQLQEAVHRRLKIVLQKCDQHSMAVSRTQLLKQLRHIQELQRRVETVEDSLVSSQGPGRSLSDLLETGQATLEAYRMMRTGNSTLP